MLDLLLHSVGDSGEHGGTSGKDGVTVQVLPDVHVALHDGLIGGLVDSSSFHSDEGRLEEHLGAAESLVSDGDDLAVREFVALFKRRRVGGGGQLLLEVQGNVAKLLLDVADDFPLG